MSRPISLGSSHETEPDGDRGRRARHRHRSRVLHLHVFDHRRRQGIGGYHLTAKFKNVEGINIGSDVRMSGIKIGSVTNQALDNNTFDAILTFAIDPTIKLPDDSTAKISSEGLLGGKFIALEPGGTKRSSPMAAPSPTRKALDIWSLVSDYMFSGKKGSKAAAVVRPGWRPIATTAAAAGAAIRGSSPPRPQQQPPAEQQSAPAEQQAPRRALRTATRPIRRRRSSPIRRRRTRARARAANDRRRSAGAPGLECRGLCEKHARFVSDLAGPVLEWLQPQAGQRILDLGCGDGVLTEGSSGGTSTSSGSTSANRCSRRRWRAASKRGGWMARSCRSTLSSTRSSPTPPFIG